MNKINIAEFHPIADIQENTIFSANGNVVLAFEAVLPEIYSLSENDFEDLHASWFQALKSLPTGLVVHKQDIYLKKNYTSENLPNSLFWREPLIYISKGGNLWNTVAFFFSH